MMETVDFVENDSKWVFSSAPLILLVHSFRDPFFKVDGKILMPLYYILLNDSYFMNHKLWIG